ncbi:MAG TPA: PQQ-binding-like beta-propeller repeat protein [Gemmata sp.]|nr:PQQ-binding-like beta-propeller repeat protein [Gemmata sp.]
MTRILSLAFTFALAPAMPAADWPQFLGPSRDGQCTETKLDWNWPKEGPPVAWKKDVGTGWAGPVVAGDALVLFHRVGNDEVVAVLDPATGREKWSTKYVTKYRDDFDFDNGPRATPLIADGKVFTLGANGDLHAWELTGGKKLWGRKIRDDYRAAKGFFGIACSPILVDKKILVNVGGEGAGVVAFDPASGKELWKATSDAGSYSSPTAAEIDGKLAAVFLTRFGLRVLDPANGKVLYELPWRPRLEASVQAATPIIWKDEIFLTVSYSQGAVVVKAKGGELTEVWPNKNRLTMGNDRTLSSQYNTPVRVGDYLYGVHGRSDGAAAQLRCVEWKTGAVKWSEQNFGVASLIAVDGGVLALTEGGELVRFDATTEGYKERGRATILSKPTRAAPALADGRLFARDGSKLICVKLK